LYLKLDNFKINQVIINQINNNTGFIKFDQRGVLAANNTSQTISPTIKTKASGQLVINQVIFHNHFTFFNAQSISSILNQIKNIKTIIALAHKKEFIISHHIIKDDEIKNINTIIQIVKSSLVIESFKIDFIINY
jgi:predicted metallo-beta-lactamase superfamily hydrolase